MADSETNRKLPSITRRNLLAGAAAASVTAAAAKPAVTTSVPDPAVALWQQWRSAQKKANALSLLKQRLEKKLLEACGGYPRATFQLPGRAEPVTAVYDFEIVELPNDSLEVAAIKARARTELEEQHEKWWEAADAIGYGDACKAQREADEVQDGLAKTLWKAPARSIPGVIAKLHSLIDLQSPGPQVQEEPWAELRSILADLVWMDAGGSAT